MNSIKCSVCDKTFTSNDLLNKHINSKHITSSTSTSVKRRIENDKNSMKHRRVQDNNEMIKCSTCNIDIHKELMHGHKRSNEHKNKCSVVYKDKNIEIVKSSFKSRINSYRVNNMKSDELSIQNFLDDAISSVFMLINENLEIHSSLKVNVELFCGFMLEKNEEMKYDIKSFNTKNEIITLSSELKEIYKQWADTIVTKSEDFNERESGWHLIEILYLEVNINKYNPLRASSYIKLPECIIRKKAVINVKNYDNECFGHAIVSALKPVEINSSLLSSYPNFRSVLDCSGIDFPLKFTDIDKFERQNNISINVFGLNAKKDKIMGPLHHTKERRFTHINLLYLEEKEKSHFCWIKNMSRLVSRQLSLNTRRKHICDGCLQYFPKESLLLEHQKEECGKVRVILPYGGNFSPSSFETNQNY